MVRSGFSRWCAGSGGSRDLPGRARDVAPHGAFLPVIRASALSDTRRVQTRQIECGKAACHCHETPGNRHGPYHYWTRKVRGKTQLDDGFIWAWIVAWVVLVVRAARPFKHAFPGVKTVPNPLENRRMGENRGTKVLIPIWPRRLPKTTANTGVCPAGSSQRSVQLWPVSMVNKSSIVSDLRGWRTPSVSGEELQAPGKSVPPGITRGLPVPRG